MTDQVTNSRFSRLHLVDLAGSERYFLFFFNSKIGGIMFSMHSCFCPISFFFQAEKFWGNRREIERSFKY